MHVTVEDEIPFFPYIYLFPSLSPSILLAIRIDSFFLLCLGSSQGYLW